MMRKVRTKEVFNEAEMGAYRKEPDWEPAEKLLERIQASGIVKTKTRGNAG